MFDVNPITSAKHFDCGPTCLQMLLAYYGHDVPLDVLTRECNTRLIGCSGSDLLRVGRAHGLDGMVAYQMDAATVLRNDRPSIILWRYNHWCVCCGTDDAGNAVICNPDLGRYRMPVGMFESLFSGVALCNGRPADILPGDYFGENEPEPAYFDD